MSKASATSTTERSARPGIVRRVFPFFSYSLVILAVWLLLQGSLAPVDLIVGGLLAVLLPQVMVRLAPEPLVFGNPRALLQLSLLVLIDIGRSNIAVTNIVLGMHKKERVSGFLEVPLELTDRNGLAALAGIISATPGTSWIDYDRKRSVVTLHVLDLYDREQWIATIKNRYERYLLEIFK